MVGYSSGRFGNLCTSFFTVIIPSSVKSSGSPFYRYRLQTVRSLAGVSLMLRLLWACLRWDDMSVKPSAAVGTTRTGTLT